MGGEAPADVRQGDSIFLPVASEKLTSEVRRRLAIDNVEIAAYTAGGEGGPLHVIFAQLFGRVPASFDSVLREVLSQYLRFDEMLGDVLHVHRESPDLWPCRLVRLDKPAGDFAICAREDLFDDINKIVQERLRSGTDDSPLLRAIAKKYFSRYLSMSTVPYFQYELGLIYCAMGYLEKAIHYLEQARKDTEFALISTSMLGLSRLSDYMEMRGIADVEAIDDSAFCKLAAIFSSMPGASCESICHRLMAQYNLARLYEESGRPARALELYEGIFARDWYFLDLRERLRLLTPQKIALGECRRNLRRLTTSLSQALDTSGSVPHALDCLVPSLLSRLPTCPVSGEPYRLVRRNRAGDFLLYCPGAHHASEGCPTGYPRVLQDRVILNTFKAQKVETFNTRLYGRLLTLLRRKIENAAIPGIPAHTREIITNAIYGERLEAEKSLESFFCALLFETVLLARLAGSAQELRTEDAERYFRARRKVLLFRRHYGEGHAPAPGPAEKDYGGADDLFEKGLAAEREGRSGEAERAYDDAFRAYFGHPQGSRMHTEWLLMEKIVRHHRYFRGSRKGRIRCPAPERIIRFLQNPRTVTARHKVGLHMGTCPLCASLSQLWVELKSLGTRFSALPFSKIIGKETLSWHLSLSFGEKEDRETGDGKVFREGLLSPDEI